MTDQPKKTYALKLTWSAYPHMPMFLESYKQVHDGLEAMLGESDTWDEAEGDSVTIEIVEVDEGFIASLEPWEI